MTTEQILDERIIYAIRNNAAGIKKILIAAGYNQVSTPEEMHTALLEYLSEDEEAVIKFVQEHPDYDLCIEAYQATQPQKSTEPVITPLLLQSRPEKKVDEWQPDYIKLLMFLACVFLVLKIFKD